MSNVPNVTNATLAKFVDQMLTTVRFRDGSAPAADPNAFKDRLGAQLTADDSAEVDVNLKVNPDGATAWVTIQVKGSKTLSVEGTCNIASLAAILA